MTSTQFPVILTTEGAAASNEDVVGDNVSVVNAMYRALLNSEEIAPNSLRSYFVDFYLAQALDGGFAQYVFMSPDRSELDVYIREGLEAMGATRHLELFNRTAELFDSLSEDDAETYLDGDLDEVDGRSGDVDAIEALDGEFEELLETEDVTGLNAAWLRGQEGLLVLSETELEEHIAARVAQVPNLGERQAEAAEDAPEFELIIRELCAMAGYKLEKITMGDPNFEFDGRTILAWHFTTDHGDFAMIEEDDEAFMINPETEEIIAAVEFEDDDELIEA